MLDCAASEAPYVFSRAVLRRKGVITVAFVIGLASSLLDPSTMPRDAEALAADLGRASGSVVRGLDIRWEPSRGMFTDLVLGRFVLFLGSETADGPRDVYRARVRLSPEGRPLGIAWVGNLTGTPLGDDHALVVASSRAAYATFAGGREMSVTALDLAGEGDANVATKVTDRAMAFVTNLQQTGSGEGIARIDVTLEQPARRVGLALSADVLDIELADDEKSLAPTRTGRLDLVKRELAFGKEMRAEPGRHLPKRFIHWAVDTVRVVTGPEPIAWLEENVFAARDSMNQLIFRASSNKDSLAKNDTPPPPPTVLDAAQAAADVGHWPPPPVRSIWKTPEAGEGEWTAPKQPWLKRHAAPEGGEAPSSPFMITYLRVDEERPYSKVLLVAMDMRQLDFDMEAGTEDPKPLTGPPGTGRLPRDPAVYTRVAAAFNGGFKTEHGAYGMMVKRRVLLPPMPGSATVIVTKDGRVGLGSWGAAKDNGAIIDVPWSEILSLRQNLDPLVDADKVNPASRWQWGYTLPGTGVQTERSGLCVTTAGHLVYAWGDDVSATTLAKAMKMGGCVYGMHLDMNPHHTGFLFTNITEFKGRNYKSELLSPQMEIDTDKYILYAAKDFFFVMLHDPTPPAFEGAKWSPDPGVQPAPSFLPGLWSAHEGKVELFAIEPARASFRIRAGTKEPEPKDGTRPAHELTDDDAHRVLFALTTGVSETKRLRGLATDGRIVLPISSVEKHAMLVAAEDGTLLIIPTKGFGLAQHADAVELPLLLDEGEPVAPHNPHGRASLGITKDGRVYVARGAVEDMTAALKKAGCQRAVLLERGTGVPSATFRAGTATPPRSRYDETTIYAMSKPMLPRGFKFEAQTPYEPPKKK